MSRSNSRAQLHSKESTTPVEKKPKKEPSKLNELFTHIKTEKNLEERVAFALKQK